MTIYTLTKDAAVLGAKDETFGYKYWAETDKGNVMFSSHKTNILESMQLVAEESVPKKSAKGNDYQWLKKVKIDDSGSQGSGSTSVSATNEAKSQPAAGSLIPPNKLIYDELKKINIKLDRLMGEEEPKKDVVEDVEDGWDAEAALADMPPDFLKDENDK
jgi:hypothetical protein